MAARIPIERSRTSRGAAIALLATLLIAAGLAGGCGGDDEQAPTAEGTSAAGSTESAPAEQGAEGTEGATGAEPEPLTPAALTDIVGRFLTSGDPAIACREVVTDELIRSAYGDRSGCAAAQVPGSVADRVRVSGIGITDSTAVATAVPEGGVSDGVDLTIKLEQTDGVWLIDSLSADLPVGP